MLNVAFTSKMAKFLLKHQSYRLSHFGCSLSGSLASFLYSFLLHLKFLAFLGHFAPPQMASGNGSGRLFKGLIEAAR
jgi:hypothetical protein